MSKLGASMKWSPLLLIIGLAILALGCQTQPTAKPVYSLPELKYRLIAQFGDIFWTDSDFYPVAREGVEEKNALEQFPTIRANSDELTAILEYIRLPNKAEYTVEEKVLIYREHKRLTRAIEISAIAGTNRYNFTLRVGEGQGERIEGTITSSGEIKVLKREPSFNTYPICLAKGTLIDTPNGFTPVEHFRPGMAVWTVDNSGKRQQAVVSKTVSTPVPPSFQIVRISLDDGRTITASAGHPTAEGRALGEYQVGNTLDEGLVLTVEHLPYDAGATYDILPSGNTGLYWANGVLLKSTLIP